MSVFTKSIAPAVLVEPGYGATAASTLEINCAEFADAASEYSKVVPMVSVPPTNTFGPENATYACLVPVGLIAGALVVVKF